ncbi:hypothetical protein R6Z07M_018043 [Ovis aries]
MRSRKELLRSGFASPKTQGQREGQVFLGKLEAGASSLAPDNQSNPSFRSFRFCEHPTAASPPPETGTQEVKNWTAKKKKKKSPGPRLPEAGDTGTAESRPPAATCAPTGAPRPRRSGACAPAAARRRLLGNKHSQEHWPRARGVSWRRRKDPCPQRGVTPPPCQLRATPGAPPGHPKATPDQSWATLRPPADHSHLSPGPPPGRLPAAGGDERALPARPRLATLPRKARGTHGARRGRSAEARQGRGGAQGQGRPGLLTEAPRRRAAPGLRAAASDGPAQPLQWRCGGRGARVTAGGRPKPRRSPPSPPRRAGPPHPRRTSSPPFLPLWVLSGAGPRLRALGFDSWPRQPLLVGGKLSGPGRTSSPRALQRGSSGSPQGAPAFAVTSVFLGERLSLLGRVLSLKALEKFHLDERRRPPAESGRPASARTQGGPSEAGLGAVIGRVWLPAARPQGRGPARHGGRRAAAADTVLPAAGLRDGGWSPQLRAGPSRPRTEGRGPQAPARLSRQLYGQPAGPSPATKPQAASPGRAAPPGPVRRPPQFLGGSRTSRAYLPDSRAAPRLRTRGAPPPRPGRARAARSSGAPARPRPRLAHASHAPHAPRASRTRRPRPAANGRRRCLSATPTRRPRRPRPAVMSQSESPGLQEESLHGSWVELHFGSNGSGGSVPDSASIYNGDMEKILLDAQHESGRSSSKSSHCDSPPRSQTPQDTNRASETDAHSLGEKNSSQSEEDYMERRKEVESILKKNSDWIWDWSSRPENIPPAKELLLLRHPKRAPTLSMRNTSVMKKGGIFSAEFLKVFLPSLLLSHLLAIGLGIYIGRRLTTSTSTF